MVIKRKKSKQRVIKKSKHKEINVIEQYICIYCRESLTKNEIFYACKCKGTHVSHKKCIEHIIQKCYTKCSICNTEFKINYIEPSNYEIIKILIKEYITNTQINIKIICKNVLYFITELSIFIFKIMSPVILKMCSLYINYKLNYYLISFFLQETYVSNIFSMCSLYINYYIVDWIRYIVKMINDKKIFIKINKISNFEVLPYQKKDKDCAIFSDDDDCDDLDDLEDDLYISE